MKLWKTDDEDGDELIENFLSGQDVKNDEIMLEYDLMGNIAHCKMLSEVGILKEDEWKKIRDIMRELASKDIEIEASDEDIHTKIENLIAERHEAGKKIHTGRSRNDQVVLDTRLFMKDQVIEIALDALQIIEDLIKKAEEGEKLLMPGYTHHQQAMPSTAGLWFGSFAEAIMDDVRNLEGCYSVINQNPLGAAASYGTSLPIDRDLTTEYLGFSQVQSNTLYSISSRGKIESLLLDDLDQFLLDINRFATDVVLFSTEEFDMIELDDELVTGSSIMPQKRNPDVAEILKGRTNKMLGSSQDMKNILSNNMSGYNRDSQETKDVLINYLENFAQILDVFKALIRGISIKDDATEKIDEEAYAAFTANRLVEEGKPFREAYREVKRGKVENENDDFLSKMSVQGSPGNLNLEQMKKDREKIQKSWKEREKNFKQRKENLLG